MDRIAYSLEFSSKSIFDFHIAYQYYLVNSENAAQKFVTEFEKSIEFIRHNPKSSIKVKPKIYRYIISGFPYIIYYKLSKKNIVILTILSGYRSPKYISKSLK